MKSILLILSLLFVQTISAQVKDLRLKANGESSRHSINGQWLDWAVWKPCRTVIVMEPTEIIIKSVRYHIVGAQNRINEFNEETMYFTCLDPGGISCELRCATHLSNTQLYVVYPDSVHVYSIKNIKEI